MADKYNPRSNSRRSVLKSISTVTAGLAVPITAVSASSSDDNLSFLEKVRKADRLYHEEGEDVRTDYLENHDIQSSIQQGTYTLPESEDDSTDDPTIAPERVDCIDPTSCDGDIDITISLSTNTYLGGYLVNATVSLYYVNWEGTYFGTYKGGEKPVDGLGFHWPQDEWKVRDRNDIPGSTAGDYNISWDNGSWNMKGLAFDVDDREMCTDITDRDGDWTTPEAASVYLDKGDSYKDDSPIYATYLHTWEGTATGFSVGYPPSIGLSASSTAESDDLQTSLDGETLLVTTDDI